MKCSHDNSEKLHDKAFPDDLSFTAFAKSSSHHQFCRTSTLHSALHTQILLDRNPKKIPEVTLFDCKPKKNEEVQTH